METKSVGSQVNDGAMHTRDTWHRNHAKHANADDLRSRPNKVAQINVCTLNISTFILPDYTYLPTHNSAPGQIHTTSNMTYPGTMAWPQVIESERGKPSGAHVRLQCCNVARISAPRDAARPKNSHLVDPIRGAETRPNVRVPVLWANFGLFGPQRRARRFESTSGRSTVPRRRGANTQMLWVEKTRDGRHPVRAEPLGGGGRDVRAPPRRRFILDADRQ